MAPRKILGSTPNRSKANLPAQCLDTPMTDHSAYGRWMIEKAAPYLRDVANHLKYLVEHHPMSAELDGLKNDLAAVSQEVSSAIAVFAAGKSDASAAVQKAAALESENSALKQAAASDAAEITDLRNSIAALRQQIAAAVQ
jgi:phage shock protein A